MLLPLWPWMVKDVLPVNKEQTDSVFCMLLWRQIVSGGNLPKIFSEWEKKTLQTKSKKQFHSGDFCHISNLVIARSSPKMPIRQQHSNENTKWLGLEVNQSQQMPISCSSLAPLSASCSRGDQRCDKRTQNSSQQWRETETSEVAGRPCGRNLNEERASGGSFILCSSLSFPVLLIKGNTAGWHTVPCYPPSPILLVIPVAPLSREAPWLLNDNDVDTHTQKK